MHQIQKGIYTMQIKTNKSKSTECSSVDYPGTRLLSPLRERKQRESKGKRYVCGGCGGTYTIKPFAKAVILGFGARNPRSARTFYWYGNAATLIIFEEEAYSLFPKCRPMGRPHHLNLCQGSLVLGNSKPLLWTIRIAKTSWWVTPLTIADDCQGLSHIANDVCM